ncbi:helix-turn-helix domain-containing protein [Mycobacterium sp. URHB0021]
MEAKLLAVFSSDVPVKVTTLCRELGISRQTLYKYRRRFEAEGPAGLVERSRRPYSSPQRISSETEDAIIRLREERWILPPNLRPCSQGRRPRRRPIKGCRIPRRRRRAWYGFLQNNSGSPASTRRQDTSAGIGSVESMRPTAPPAVVPVHSCCLTRSSGLSILQWV